MEILRTPEERFADLTDWPYEPRYMEVEGLRMHYVDAGPADADPVLLLHGEPTWSYLYRKVIPEITAAGLRAVAWDMVGFGRSDKPAAIGDHSYAAHVRWLRGFVDALGLARMTLVGQDWGGLLGLRLLAEVPDRFAGVVAANTALPTGDHEMPELWQRFRQFVASAEDLPISWLIDQGCVSDLPAGATAAYDAPFPDAAYKAGPRVMPELVPYFADHPASEENRRAWEVLVSLETPLLTAFSDSDPITGPAAAPFRDLIPGARGLEHPTITGAGHFLQEDRGEELGRVVAEFATRTLGARTG